ncbi:MAG: sigma-54-dependent Fis family transcriptional regulator [Bdellovibrionales bacterium]|nr:sigma-54-dependent Fis family transcriptional regulator [Bdellovibrionales bacterium]
MILIVDDEAENRETLSAILEREGFACMQAASAPEALTILRENPAIRLLITDMKMPGGMDGLELLQSARIVRPDVQRLLVTAFGTVEDTVTAMRAGAFDVLAKPLRLKTIKETVARLLERASQSSPPTKSTAAPLHPQLSAPYARVMELLRRAAPSQASVLFTGESGVGKSFLAKALHQWSERREAPFIALNCAAIPEELLESELFGYEKGAFTGAVQSRDGKIIAANKGTLLLDEISDLSPNLQAKLLQFIQEKKFFKLGSNKEISADVRIVAATNRSLTELVQKGLFREDLLYRLRVIEITVPPLRERKEDLLWLIPALLDNLAEKNGQVPVRFTHAALAKLWSYDWPGNIRELENIIESTLVMAPQEELREGFISEAALPEQLRGQDTRTPVTLPDLATVERQAIQQALVVTGGNRRLAAHLLGISERTLYRVLEPKA